MNSSQTWIRAAVSGLLAASAALANATPLTWNFSNTAFDDGTTVTGHFSYDAASDTLLSYSISVGSGTLPGKTYDGTDSFLQAPIGAGYWATNELVLPTNDSSTYLLFNFASALTDAGGLVSLSTDSSDVSTASWEQSFADTPVTRYITQGAITTQVVPEPASLALCSIAGLGLALSRRRKRA